MQDYINSTTGDEVSLREVFMTLWAYKLLISTACALGILLSGNYALNAKKVFTSVALFKLDQNNSTSIKFNGELGALADLIGMDSGQANNNLPEDQIKGRIFIESLDAKLNFQDDPFFNSYNPNPVDPIWKSFIKHAIGWKRPARDINESIWQGITAKYSGNINLDKTDNGSLKIKVTHENAQRAAEIANVIMETIISNAKNKFNTSQDRQLKYLSTTLANTLNDLEVSQSNLKDFTLENSALPLENFAVRSLQLDALRENLSRTIEMRNAVAALSLILENQALNMENYLSLRQQFPIVDQVEFRRVLGQNEIISSWSWPEISSVKAVFDTLSERKSRLQSQINASQINAERSSQALETYARLEREAKIAEATYTVMIEQVKAQSMVAGYRPNKTEIFEYASASINPSAPNRKLILTLGLVLGLFLGISVALILAFFRGVYYSKKSLLTDAKAPFTASIKTLTHFHNKNLNKINTILMKKPISVLRDITTEIHKSNTTQVMVTSSRTRFISSDVAKTLASYIQTDTIKVAIIDFSSKERIPDIDTKRLSGETFIVSEHIGNVSVLRPASNYLAIDLLSQKDFIKNIHSVSSTVDLLFLCADNVDAISLLRAFEEQKIYHITLAKTKRTKAAELRLMRSLLPIQGLLYD